MPFNGSGSYTLPVGQPVITGTVIDSTVFNALTSDLATALTNCVTRDGQSPATGNIPLGANRITGLAAGVASTDGVNLTQVQALIQNGALQLLTSVAGTNTITATATGPIAAYAAGQMFVLIPANTTTGAVTLNISSAAVPGGIGAANVFFRGAALTGGEIVLAAPAVLAYDGTRFNLLNSSAQVFSSTIFQARSSATTSLADNTNTRVALGAETIDIGGNFSTNFYTVPSTGFYYFYGCVGVSITNPVGSTVQTLIEVADGGGVSISTTQVATGIVTVAANPAPFGATIINVTAGQRVYLMGFQNNGGARNAQSGGVCVLGGWRVS